MFQEQPREEISLSFSYTHLFIPREHTACKTIDFFSSASFIGVTKIPELLHKKQYKRILFINTFNSSAFQGLMQIFEMHSYLSIDLGDLLSSSLE